MRHYFENSSLNDTRVAQSHFLPMRMQLLYWCTIEIGITNQRKNLTINECLFEQAIFVIQILSI